MRKSPQRPPAHPRGERHANPVAVSPPESTFRSRQHAPRMRRQRQASSILPNRCRRCRRRIIDLPVAKAAPVGAGSLVIAGLDLLSHQISVVTKAAVIRNSRRSPFHGDRRRLLRHGGRRVTAGDGRPSGCAMHITLIGCLPAVSAIEKRSTRFLCVLTIQLDGPRTSRVTAPASLGEQKPKFQHRLSRSCSRLRRPFTWI